MWRTTAWECRTPLGNAGKPHDVTGNIVSTTMFPAHSPGGGTGDARDLKSVLPSPQTPIDSSTYNNPAKNSASYLAQIAVKFPDLEKLANLWPRLRPDVKKMIVGVAVSQRVHRVPIRREAPPYPRLHGLAAERTTRPPDPPPGHVPGIAHPD